MKIKCFTMSDAEGGMNGCIGKSRPAVNGSAVSSLSLMFRPVAMGGHGVADAIPGQQDTIFLPPQRIFLQFLLLLYLYGQGEISYDFDSDQPWSCSIPENLTFSCTNFIH